MRDWQEFIASLIGSLAWPMAVLAMAWMFRSSLGRLLSGDIKRWNVAVLPKPAS